jgi:hypothetical protein
MGRIGSGLAVVCRSCGMWADRVFWRLLPGKACTSTFSESFRHPVLSAKFAESAEWI